MRQDYLRELLINPDFGAEFVSEVGNGELMPTERLKERKENVSNLKFNVLNFIKSFFNKKELESETIYAPIGTDCAAYLLSEYPNDFVDNNGTRIVSRIR